LTPGAVLGMSLAAPDLWRRRDRQPFVDSDAMAVVVADCRLDNRPALRAALDLEAEATDGAILLRGYERWGADLPSRLTGDFAGVLWDWRNNRLVGFRDPLGIKPLFYGYFLDQLVVASDVDLILRTIRPEFLPDDRFIIEHLLRQYTSTDRTFRENIRRLPGGHALLVEAPSHSIVRRFWSPGAASARFSSQLEVSESLLDLFQKSVERRLDADGPVFAHLSGGLDSSAIVCVASEMYRARRGGESPLRALSERFPGMSCDEGDFIAAVLDRAQVEGIAWDEGSPGFSDLDKTTDCGPGMGIYRTSGSTQDVEITARSGGHVLLSGQGGDQLGSSAEVVEDMIHQRPFRFALETVGESDLTMVQRQLRVRLMLRSLLPHGVRRIVGIRRYQRRLPQWLQPRCRDLAGQIAADLYRTSELRFPDAIRRARWRDLTSASLGMTLDLNHRGAATQGVEVRYPFLDQDLVTMILAVPAEFWPRPTANARLHRAALGHLLPEIVRDRRTKAVFTETIGRRMRKGTEHLRKLFHEGDWLSQPYVNRDEAQVLLDRGLSKAPDGDWPVWRGIWGIATLEAWLRMILGYAHLREG
jgi:asparagine synthase (glutamine-hydrolysing)